MKIVDCRESFLPFGSVPKDTFIGFTIEVLADRTRMGLVGTCEEDRVLVEAEPGLIDTGNEKLVCVPIFRFVPFAVTGQRRISFLRDRLIEKIATQIKTSVFFFDGSLYRVTQETQWILEMTQWSLKSWQDHWMDVLDADIHRFAHVNFLQSKPTESLPQE